MNVDVTAPFGGATSSPAHGAPSGALHLPDWGVIRVAGQDAAIFLQSQLTQDVQMLDAQTAALAGWCSAKGRLLASFVVWRPQPEEFLLACSADVLPPTLKRLSMFVLRAKCKLTDASVELPLHGVCGADAAAPGAWRCDGARIGLPPGDGVPRALQAGAAPGLPPLDPAAWSWLEVASGIPRISAATVEQFVPQMVNLDLVGGVSFRKGCYPGQEVVARSQYRGTLKRRAFVFDAPAPASAGQELFHDADPSQPAGRVVNAASWHGHHRLFAEVKLAALEGGQLRLGSAEGPALVRARMPYEVPLQAAAA
jgi:folate-binding protein YgfZ